MDAILGNLKDYLGKFKKLKKEDKTSIIELRTELVKKLKPLIGKLPKGIKNTANGFLQGIESSDDIDKILELI